MGFRAGMLIVVVVGGAVVLMLKAKRAEAPGLEKATGEPAGPTAEASPTERAEAALTSAQQSLKAALETVRRRANEARAAAKEAAEEKETELRNRFQSLVRNR